MRKQQFIECAVKAGVVPSAAVDDPEGYDNGHTLHCLSVMWTAVCELLGADTTEPSPQAPIARLQILEDGRMATSLYAPGLPPGEHDLFCDPSAPSLAGRDLAHLESCHEAAMNRLWDIHCLATSNRAVSSDMRRIAELSEGYAPVPKDSADQLGEEIG